MYFILKSLGLLKWLFFLYFFNANILPKKIHEILGYYAITKQVLDDAKLTQKRAKRVKQQSLNFFLLAMYEGCPKNS